jgi:hypothetical protein
MATGTQTPAPAPAPAPAGGVVAAVEADVSSFSAKVKAAVVKYGPYAAGLIVGALLGHVL